MFSMSLAMLAGVGASIALIALILLFLVLAHPAKLGSGEGNWSSASCQPVHYHATQGTNVATTHGMSTTVAASDTIVTGLALLYCVVCNLNDDPVDGAMHASASIGDQAGTPAAGSFLLKTWKSTDADATLVAATTFSKKVAWVAYGRK